MKVILDPQAGICGGVKRAIKLAEEELENDNSIYVLGDIIHNEKEVERLDKAGLKTIHIESLIDIDGLDFKPGDRVLVRAHGEPPETFEKLREFGVDVIDGTCPVVTRSQELALEYQSKGCQVVVVGKQGHPEVIGIVGHTGNKAIVVQTEEDIERLKQGVKTVVMAQTTISPERFDRMTDLIRKRVGEIEVMDTICRFVVRRDRKLPEFAGQADVILVVGGHKSSNTRMLFATCKTINDRSYHVVDTTEIDLNWFRNAETIGVTGSASTPLWLLEEFVNTLNRWIEEGRL